MAESSQLRSEIAAEFANLQAASQWVETGYSAVRAMRSWWPLAAGALGLVLGTRSGRRGGWLGKLGKIWSFWKVVSQLSFVWRGYFSRAGAGKTSS